jgi:hypothetical protein
MSDGPRQQLANVLRDVRGVGSFATRRTAPLGDLSIEVRDVGALRLPVTAAQGKQLRLVSRPARYGNGEDTLLDRQVRDTWEVPKSRVTIGVRRWTNTLRPVLDLVRDDLGLSSTSTLDAELHSMLVYEPGQFFAAHQDSEKDDRMIGSLVVLLPSRSTGGDLVVSHRGETVRYKGSATALTFIAFYADTRHEVLPVTSGYRVALTYSLCLAGTSAGPIAVRADRMDTVAALLAEHFSTPVAPRWRHDSAPGERPDRLVFLLDHQYSEHSLRWPQLKGDDATRAAVIRGAAERAGFDTALALAEVQETWDVEYDDYYPRRGRRGWSQWDGPDPDDVESLGSLIDSNVEIRAVDGRIIGGKHVAEAELAAVTPSVELEPDDTEYTGNMGNYGNTMDRWYRRAAIAIWPRSRAFALRAKGDPAGALAELLTSPDVDTSPDDDVTAERHPEMVSALLRFWPEAVRSNDQRTLVNGALLLATQLDEPDLAARLLDPFVLEALAPTDAAALVAAAQRHGASWFDERIASWTNQRWNTYANGLPTRAEWVDTLPAFRNQLVSVDGDTGTSTASVIIEAVWAWLRRTLHATDQLAGPSARRTALDGLGQSLLAILRACSTTPTVRAGVVETVCSPGTDLSPLIVGVITAAAGLSPSDLAAVDLRPFAEHCAGLLQHELARPERAEGDWSIPFSGAGCCNDCAELATFLHDAARKQMVWPLAKPRREHIHQRIDSAEMPVTHQTRREGSPHKLVLTKTADVFAGDQRRRMTARTSLDTIERVLRSTGAV